VKSPTYQKVAGRWIVTLLATGLGGVAIFATEWTVAEKVAGVVGVVLLSAVVLHIDYLAGVIVAYRGRIRYLEERLSHFSALVTLALPFRPVLVTGIRKDNSGFVLILSPQERSETKPAEHLIVMDALARGRVIATAVTSQFAGPQLDEARVVDIEDNFEKVLSERLQAYDHTLPQHLVVLRRDEIERLLTTLGGPQWRSR